jgi:hypothetical protein
VSRITEKDLASAEQSDDSIRHVKTASNTANSTYGRAQHHDNRNSAIGHQVIELFDKVIHVHGFNLIQAREVGNIREEAIQKTS